MPRLRDSSGNFLGEEDEFLITYTGQEIMEAVSPPEDWGPWILNTDSLSLEYGNRYDVDLESCLNSAQVLDWIIQVSHKSWVDNSVLAGLIRALDDVLNAQANLCSFGKQKEITVTKLRKLVRDTAANRKESLRVYGEGVKE